jgi:hypothetical protein
MFNLFEYILGFWKIHPILFIIIAIALIELIFLIFCSFVKRKESSWKYTIGHKVLSLVILTFLLWIITGLIIFIQYIILYWDKIVYYLGLASICVIGIIIYFWINKKLVDTSVEEYKLLKSGTKIRIRKGLKIGRNYDGIEFSEEKRKFLGKIVTIKEYCTKRRAYHIKEMPGLCSTNSGCKKYHFTDAMFEGR